MIQTPDNPPPVISTDGTQIATYEAGRKGAPALLLIHGWAQHSICWSGLSEILAERFHIIAMDLRGHGASDKPEGADPYTSEALWADDVAAVISAYGLSEVTLVGWSYGARLIAAYLSQHGDAAVAGVALAGGISALGAAREEWMMGAASPALDRDLSTADQARALAATARFVAACTTAPLPRELYGQLVGANMLCPAHVRRALFAADADMRRAFGAMSCPGLVIHGTQDCIVTPASGEANAAAMRLGQYLPYEGIGHAPFLEAPDRFAQDLAAFVTANTEKPEGRHMTNTQMGARQ